MSRGRRKGGGKARQGGKKREGGKARGSTSTRQDATELSYHKRQCNARTVFPAESRTKWGLLFVSMFTF